eukprot:7201292-Pyramimonas_sp.AAC.1
MQEVRQKRGRSEELDVKVRELKDVAHAKMAQHAKVKRSLSLKETALEATQERRLDIVRCACRPNKNKHVLQRNQLEDCIYL